MEAKPIKQTLQKGEIVFAEKDIAKALSWTHQRARVAALSRDREPDDPELQEARQSLKEARTLAAMDTLVAQAKKVWAEEPDFRTSAEFATALAAAFLAKVEADQRAAGLLPEEGEG